MQSMLVCHIEGATTFGAPTTKEFLGSQLTTYERWAMSVPDTFQFAVKLPRESRTRDVSLMWGSRWRNSSPKLAS